MISHLRDKRALELIKLISDDYGDYVKKYVNGVEVKSLKIRGGLDEIHVEYEEKEFDLRDYPDKLSAVEERLINEFDIKFNFITKTNDLILLQVYDEPDDFYNTTIAGALRVKTSDVIPFYVIETNKWIYCIDLRGIDDDV